MSDWEKTETTFKYQARCIHLHNLTYTILQVREAEGNQGGRTLLGHYCRHPPPPIATSPRKNILEVNFVSDYSVAMNGFRLEWIVNGVYSIHFYEKLKKKNYNKKCLVNFLCMSKTMVMK